MIIEYTRYGAVAAKCRAMYGRRLTSREFKTLAEYTEMSQIAVFLRQHPGWAGVLSELPLADPHRGQIEMMLYNALFAEYNSLRHYIKKRDLPLLAAWLGPFEAEQVLAFVRVLDSGRPEDYRLFLPPDIRRRMPVDYLKLVAARSYDDMLDAFSRSPLLPVLRRFRPSDGGRVDYTALELALSGHTLRRIYEQAGRRGGANKTLLRGIGERADIVNIGRVTRLREYFNSGESELLGCLLPHFDKLDVDFFKRLYRTDSREQADELLKATPYRRLFERYSLDYIEQYALQFSHDFYLRALRASRPGMLIPIAYLELRLVEIQNLIHLIECVKYNLPKDRIFRQLTLELDIS